MSHIPNSAMPHAIAKEPTETQAAPKSSRIGASAGKVADLARENPKTAIAAGAAVVAGLAAAAIPLVRSLTSSDDSKPAKSGKKTKADA